MPDNNSSQAATDGSERPSGGWQLTVGWVCVAAAAILFVTGMMTPSDAGISISAMFYASMFLSAALFFFFWGSVIRAIWFLPGRVISTPASSSSADGVADNYLG